MIKFILKSTFVFTIIIASLTLIPSLLNANDKVGAKSLWKPADLIAGYKQNILRFKGLNIIWHRSSEFQPAWFLHRENTIRYLESELKSESDSGAKAKLNAQIEKYRTIIDSPKNHGIRGYSLGFSTNWDSYMILWSKDGQKQFSLTDFEIPTADNLTSKYKSDQLFIFNPASEPPFHLWHGRFDEHSFSAQTLAAFPSLPGIGLPPLANVPIEYGGPIHPIDEFFQFPESNYRIADHPVPDDLPEETVVLELVRENTDARSYLTEPQLLKYADRLKRVSIARAFINPDQGFLPLRIEWDNKFMLDGKPLATGHESSSQPYQLMSDVKIVEIDDGGFYPMSGSIEHRHMDPEYDGPIVTIGQFLEGAKLLNIPTKTQEIDRWEILEINADAVPSYDIEFPVATRIYDEVTASSLVTGNVDLLIKQVAGNPTMPESQISWFFWGNTALCITLILIFFIRMWSRRRVSH